MAMDMTKLLEGDLVSAARRRLITKLQNTPDMLGTGGLVGQDGVDGKPQGAYSQAWVFPGLDNDGRPLRPVEGSNKVSVTILGRDHWNSNPHNTMSMPVLRFLIFADTMRQPDGNPAGRVADLRVKKAAKLIDELFHVADNGSRAFRAGEQGSDGHLWNEGLDEELYVISCYRSPGGGLNITDVIDNDFAVRGDLRYEVALRDWG